LEPVPFEQFRNSLQPVGVIRPVDPATLVSIQEVANSIQGLEEVTREGLTRLVAENPNAVPVLALVCRVSQEKLKSALQHGLGSAGWKKLARSAPRSIVDLLDDRFGLVEEVTAQRQHSWTFADMLVERRAGGLNAARTVGIGRLVENQVEELVKSLGLPYQMRTEFVGRYGRRAPCDVAIPAGGESAEIVVAIKSFGSTGSKQTDAVREIEEMADVRESRQFAFAFLDGIGWLRRQSDLRRIVALWEQRKLDGVFNLSMLAAFRGELQDAARRRGLLPAT